MSSTAAVFMVDSEALRSRWQRCNASISNASQVRGDSAVAVRVQRVRPRPRQAASEKPIGDAGGRLLTIAGKKA